MRASERYRREVKALAVEVVAPQQSWVAWATEAGVAVGLVLLLGWLL